MQLMKILSLIVCNSWKFCFWLFYDVRFRKEYELEIFISNWANKRGVLLIESKQRQVYSFLLITDARSIVWTLGVPISETRFRNFCKLGIVRLTEQVTEQVTNYVCEIWEKNELAGKLTESNRIDVRLAEN